MRNKELIDIFKVLNANLAENPFYRALFQVLGDELDKQIGEPVAQLLRSRSNRHIYRGDYIKTPEGKGRVGHVERYDDENGQPMDKITLTMPSGASMVTHRRAMQDRGTLIDGARFLGFEYYSDYMRDEDYARLYEYISSYWDHSGRPNFEKFIGYVKNVELSLEPLWSEEVESGERDDQGRPIMVDAYPYLEPKNNRMVPVHKGGKHFQTSHVELRYDALYSDSLDEDLVYLFYLLAPIHLVLERIVGRVDVEITYSLQAAPHVALIDYGVLDLSDV